MSSRPAFSTKARDETTVRIDRRADRGRDVGRPGRVVDHRRDAAGRQQAEQRQDDAVGVGQQHADRLAGRAHRFEALAEDARAGEQLAVAERAADDVLDDDACDGPNGDRGVAHRLEQAVIAVGSPRRRASASRSNSALAAVVAAALGAFGEFGQRHRLERGDRQASGTSAAAPCRPASARTASGARRRRRSARSGRRPCMAMRATARNRRNDLASGLDLVGKIDGEPALALQQRAPAGG